MGWVEACGHCGSRLVHYVRDSHLEPTLAVRCCGCGARGPEVPQPPRSPLAVGPQVYKGAGWRAARELAMERWNGRQGADAPGRLEVRTNKEARELLMVLDRSGVLDCRDFPDLMLEVEDDTEQALVVNGNGATPGDAGLGDS